MNNISFEDSWIFLAMKYAENESQDYYTRLIGYCDSINHAIPSYGDFIATYNKLLYISAIKNEEGMVKILEFGNAIYAAALKKRAQDSQPWELVELICTELKPYKLKSACRQAPLSEQEYLAAIDRYKNINL